MHIVIVRMAMMTEGSAAALFITLGRQREPLLLLSTPRQQQYAPLHYGITATVAVPHNFRPSLHFWDVWQCVQHSWKMRRKQHRQKVHAKIVIKQYSNLPQNKVKYRQKACWTTTKALKVFIHPSNMQKTLFAHALAKNQHSQHEKQHRQRLRVSPRKSGSFWSKTLQDYGAYILIYGQCCLLCNETYISG